MADYGTPQWATRGTRPRLVKARQLPAMTSSIPNHSLTIVGPNKLEHVSTELNRGDSQESVDARV